VKVNHGNTEPRHEDLDKPLSTVTATQRGHALVAPTLIQTGYGERPGQAARVPGLHKPIGTLVDGQKHALVGAWLVKHYGDPTDAKRTPVLGSALSKHIGTITARDHHSLAAVTLAKFRGTADNQPGCASIEEPLPTITSGGNRGGVHVAEVRAFLTAYYGNDATSGQQLDLPLRTATTRARFGLVLVEGTEYQVVDIGLRMLEPHELLRAQYGKYADGYDLSDAPTKAKKVKLIGNSVSPENVVELLRANVCREEEAAA